jgi:DNA-binding GntR family transcriptional regulator
MRLLVDKKGLLMGWHGIRILVAPQPVRRTDALPSLYDDPKEAGREPRTRVLALRQHPTRRRRERKFKNDPDHEWLC